MGGKTKLYLDALFREMDYVAEKMKGGRWTPFILGRNAHIAESWDLDALLCKVEVAFDGQSPGIYS